MQRKRCMIFLSSATLQYQGYLLKRIGAAAQAGLWIVEKRL